MSDIINTFIQEVLVNKAQSVANTWTLIGTVPDTAGVGTFANTGLNILNTSSTDTVTFSLAISLSTTPNLDDYIESNISLSPGSVLSRNNLILNPNENVYINASTTDLACRMYGVLEEIITNSTYTQVTASISSLQTQQQTDMTNIASLSAQQQTDMTNIAALQTDVSNIDSEQASHAAAITALLNQQAADENNITALQNTTSSLSSSLSNTQASTSSQISALTSTVNNTVAGLFSNMAIQTGNRGFGGTYQNNSGGPMFVSVFGNHPGCNQGFSLDAYVDGNWVCSDQGDLGGGTSYCGGTYRAIAFMVPNGSTYQVNESFIALSGWIEWTV